MRTLIGSSELLRTYGSSPGGWNSGGGISGGAASVMMRARLLMDSGVGWQ